MRRRINRQVKQEIKPIEKKEEKKEVKLLPKKEIQNSDICSNILPNNSYIRPTTEQIVGTLEGNNGVNNGINDFLNVLFTNVLQMKYRDRNDEEHVLDGNALWTDTKNYIYPTQYLVAGSVLLYAVDKCNYGFIIDKVIDSETEEVISSVDILFNGQVPQNELLKKHISWVIACDGTAIAGADGALIGQIADYLDFTKTEIPNNTGVCSNPVVTHRYMSPIKIKSKQQIPPQDQMPHEPSTTSEKSERPACVFTGYFFMYNLNDLENPIEDTINLTLNYVRVPVYVSGLTDCITLGNGNIKGQKKTQESETKKFFTLSGNNTIVQLPRSSEFYQVNMGDQPNSGYYSQGEEFLMVPSIFFE